MTKVVASDPDGGDHVYSTGYVPKATNLTPLNILTNSRYSLYHLSGMFLKATNLTLLNLLELTLLPLPGTKSPYISASPQTWLAMACVMPAQTCQAA